MISRTFDIQVVDADLLPAVLPLIGEYQAFYGVACDPARTAAHFEGLIADSRRGALLAAVSPAGEVAGFATLYHGQSTLQAGPTCILNDLFVRPVKRRQGLAIALMEHVSNYARARGFAHIEWQTQPHNREAKALYDGLGAKAQTWDYYSWNLDLDSARNSAANIQAGSAL